MKKYLLWGSGLVLLIIVLAVIFMTYNDRRRNAPFREEVVVDSILFLSPAPPAMLYGYNIDSLTVEEGVIQRNENLSEILGRFNITPATIAELNNFPKDTFNVRKLRAQKPYTVIHSRDSSKTAMAFIYHPNPVEYVMIEFGDSLTVHRGTHKVDTLVEMASGVIELSLYHSVMESGGSPMLVNELADVYAWEIDFFGLQKGDAFKVIYQRYEVNGQKAGMGKIIGAWFRHMDHDFYAVQYDQGEGKEYFDEEGKSLRKTFLKAPLKFSRISSRFSYSRYHPVLKIRRPHTGVDYAAPKGTPVVAVGDGIVTMARYKGGGGNTIKIKHNGNYTTGYLHLSGYAKGIKQGVHVQQGQVIGYVGSTGLSTGPHLDFRFWKNGKPVDPLKIDPPSANPIREDKRDDYSVIKDAMIQKVDSIRIEEPTAIS